MKHLRKSSKLRKEVGARKKEAPKRPRRASLHFFGFRKESVGENEMSNSLTVGNMCHFVSLLKLGGG